MQLWKFSTSTLGAFVGLSLLITVMSKYGIGACDIVGTAAGSNCCIYPFLALPDDAPAVSCLAEENEVLGITICSGTDCNANVVGKTPAVLGGACAEYDHGSSAPAGECTVSGEQIQFWPGVIVDGACPESTDSCLCTYAIGTTGTDPVYACDCSGTICAGVHSTYTVIE